MNKQLFDIFIINNVDKLYVKYSFGNDNDGYWIYKSLNDIENNLDNIFYYNDESNSNVYTNNPFEYILEKIYDIRCKLYEEWENTSGYTEYMNLYGDDYMEDYGLNSNYNYGIVEIYFTLENKHIELADLNKFTESVSDLELILKWIN